MDDGITRGASRHVATFKMLIARYQRRCCRAQRQDARGAEAGASRWQRHAIAAATILIRYFTPMSDDATDVISHHYAMLPFLMLRHALLHYYGYTPPIALCGARYVDTLRRFFVIAISMPPPPPLDDERRLPRRHTP